ncbi:hypothetical protein [Klebsiella quasipneumoniae]|uniref:hypothetical protein n=1 Tax=Klebsiella quasipneumoniae TaxID=1463165 RepID=UPI0014383355|nr:hypothetical protein [Klebsiella quasipneumoniae]
MRDLILQLSKSSIYSTKPRDGYVCGQVNAKNSFGAYSGFKRYVSKSGMTIIDDGGAEFSKLWGEICS